MEIERELPTLEELLLRRGIAKSEDFGDYQDFIESAEQNDVRPRLFGFSRVLPEGSMHLALGRTMSARKFRY
jgi:hypothetical protein